MTAFLFEGQRTVYIVLAIILVLLLLAWWQTRKRQFLVASVVVLGLIGLYFLLDVLVETEQEADRNQLQARIEQMAQAVGRKDTDALFQHISEKFTSPALKTRAQTYEFAKGLMARGGVTEVRVWDFEFEQQPSRAKGTAAVRFQFKAKGTEAPDMAAFGCEATFEWAGANGWLLIKVIIFDPVRGREPIPGPF
jgi:hypothetical protein